MLPSTFRLPPLAASRRGSTLILVLIVVSILSMVAGGLLFSANSRYHSTYQSASWQEALIGSEAGVDIAMNELRRHVVKGEDAFQDQYNWTGVNSAGAAYPNKGRAFPGGNSQLPFLMQPSPGVGVHGGEGATLLGTRVYVDVPGFDAPPTPNNSFKQDSSPTIDPFMNEQRDGQGVDPASRWWYRIRALGYAGVSGPPRANLDTRDNRLRKFSFFNDWRTGQAVNPTMGPYVSRLVEVVAKPLMNFRNALMADVQINLSNQDVLIDSYDSSKGLYGASVKDAQGKVTLNVGNMGNIATNGTLINANKAVVKGDAMTNEGSINQADNVSGQQRADFYQELLHVDLDANRWTNVGSGPAPSTVQSITASTTLEAGISPSAPARYRVNSINLADQKKGGPQTLLFTRPATADPNAPCYVKLYVQDSITTSGASCIELDNNVYAIIYVQGNVSLNGTGIITDDELASRLLIDGLRPPDGGTGSNPRIDLNTDQDFEGMIYAPDHELTLNMSASTSGKGKGGKDPKGDDGEHQDDHINGYNGIYGTFVAKKITVMAKTHVHYDEVLREAGPVNHYEIVNWFEDQTSRATVNW